LGKRKKRRRRRIPLENIKIMKMKKIKWYIKRMIMGLSLLSKKQIKI
jgi:hypothetical protein